MNGRDVIWYEWHQGGRNCCPDSERRVLVAQDYGYIEMAEWNGVAFVHDWPYSPRSTVRSPVPRVRYWADIPQLPTEDGEVPFQQ